MTELLNANWPYYVKDPNGTKSIRPLNDVDCIRIHQSVAELKEKESGSPPSLKMYLPFSKVKINLATMSAYSDDRPDRRLVLVQGKYNERHRVRDSMKTADASAFILKPVPVANSQNDKANHNTSASTSSSALHDYTIEDFILLWLVKQKRCPSLAHLQDTPISTKAAKQRK